MTEQTRKVGSKTTIKVNYSQRPGFKGKVVAFAFDAAGNLLDRAEVRDNKAVLSLSEEQLGRGRLFFAPVTEEMNDFRPTLAMMQRLEAYEASVRKKGQLIDSVRIPDSVIDVWVICFCLVRGRLVKGGSELPICSARVHICEVDKVWRWILRLPDLEIFRLRDDLLKAVEVPELHRPPLPDPPPVESSRITFSRISEIALNPQPEPPANITVPKVSQIEAARPAALQLVPEVRIALNSTSAQVVRQTLIGQVALIIPYLCLWPYWWWRLRYDEIMVVETDASGRFEAIVPYLCSGDKPDLYFWVEFEIGGVLETVYHPPVACHTYWNYACGTEVTLHVWDDRVPACDGEPDLSGCIVQILSIGRAVSMSQIHGNGAAPADEGLTMAGQPFGGKLEPRVWFSRSELRDGKNIKYYRWSYRRLTTGDGTPLAAPGPWQPMTRAVVRHYAKVSAGGVTHVPYPLGPTSVGAETNLFEIKPNALPPGGIEWTIMDEREDLASAHFESYNLGVGSDACAKALTAAGKYELKLELFKGTGALVDWTAEGIDLQIADVPAPFGTDTVTAVPAPDYYRIKNGGGHTMAYRMVLRIDNNCCEAEVKPVTGAGLTMEECGFIEFTPGAAATLSFRAYHANNFATFNFSVKHGVSDPVDEASAAGRSGVLSVTTNDPAPPLHSYTLGASGTYFETFAVTTLLGTCPRAAFSEALHVWAMAIDGYNRLSYLDSFDHDAFALTPSS
jgi:hypothetical protein